MKHNPLLQDNGTQYLGQSFISSLHNGEDRSGTKGGDVRLVTKWNNNPEGLFSFTLASQ